jgi:hypothetical protein
MPKVNPGNYQQKVNHGDSDASRSKVNRPEICANGTPPPTVFGTKTS